MATSDEEEGASPCDAAQESDGEESTAPSLCDLPTTTEAEADAATRSAPDALRTPPPPELFEFFFNSTTSVHMYSFADDIFLRGHLLPYKPPPVNSVSRDHNTSLGRHFRCESLPLDASRNDCRMLRRAVSDSAPPARPRPTWQHFLLAPLSRIPAEMEMRDIRSRRRRPPAPPAKAETPCWRLLRSMGCKCDGSHAVVTAPLSFVRRKGTI